MSKWNSEQEAREEIKGLVAEYYNQFKKPEQEKPYQEGDRIAYASRVYDEKELAKAELSSYLKSYGGIIEGGEMGGKFPTGFLGAKVKGSLEWNKCAENIEEFAWKVVNDCLPEDDYAEETTEIDMQKHKIKQTAKYIFDGFDVDDDLED